MTFLPFIAGSYGATLGLATVFAVATVVRIARAKRRLAAVGASTGRARR